MNLKKAYFLSLLSFSLALFSCQKTEIEPINQINNNNAQVLPEIDSTHGTFTMYINGESYTGGLSDCVIKDSLKVILTGQIIFENNLHQFDLNIRNTNYYQSERESFERVKKISCAKESDYEVNILFLAFDNSLNGSVRLYNACESAHICSDIFFDDFSKKSRQYNMHLRNFSETICYPENNKQYHIERIEINGLNWTVQK